MSRIDDLIAELCPDGVPHRALDQVVTFQKGEQLKAEDRIDGPYPVVTAGRTNESTHQEFNFGAGSVSVSSHGAYAGHINYWAEPIWLSNNVFLLAPSVPHLESRFLFFALKSRQQRVRDRVRGGGVPYMNARDLAPLRIPVPPLEVQREIVRVLDQFTQLEAELEAELEARRRQYEHYRGGLLAFSLDEVETVELSEAFETRNGYTPSKSDPTNWLNGTVPWFRMEDIRENGRVLDRALQRIPAKAVKGGRLFPAGSLIFATSATIGEHALITVPFMSNQRFTAVWPKAEYADRFDMKFLYYYGFVIDEWCRNNTTTSSFASVDMSGFKRLRIPIPPIETQRRIASQLSHFDALVNDLSVGLPAELAARRKQYEYYRDKLLTFEEAAA